MKVTIVGSGYVGLVTGACLAEVGNQVVCLDVDAKKIEILNSGGIPIHEPGLLEMVARNRAAGRISFTTDVERAVTHGDIQFIAVGTPPDEDGSADLQYVIAAARNVGRYMNGFKVIVDKSTVPVGTADKVRAAVADELAKRGADHAFAVVSNPEFLKEGAALEDFMRPDRIVVGCTSDEAGERARRSMRSLYSPFQRNHDRMLFMDVRSAELTKYAANAMLATRISFMNELANLAEVLGADIELVRQGIGSDPRIGYHFLYAGCGYGGSCFPKDVQALQRSGTEAGRPSRILEAVEAANEAQKNVLVEKLVARFGEDLAGRRFAIWGLAFKPNTDDMREAPARVLIRQILERGGAVTAHDPVAMDEAKRVMAIDYGATPQLLERIAYADTPEAALDGCDALVIVTEWKAFRSPDFEAMQNRLSERVVFDGRNLYDTERIAAYDLDYIPIGRPAHRSSSSPAVVPPGR
jgi:UDPglucose 6-dehydrogenase